MSLELSGTTPAIKGVAGSVSAPAITGDDTNTGISFPAADTIKFSTNGVERMSITDSGVTGTGIGAGKILQVKSTPKTDTFSTSSSSFVDVTGLSVDIDPIAASSKILVLVEVNTSTTGGNNAVCRLMRGSTAIAVGTASGSRPAASFQQRISDSNAAMNGSIKFLDAPTYSVGDTLTYKVQVFSQANPLRINSTYSDTDASAIARTFSSITVMEVGA